MQEPTEFQRNLAEGRRLLAEGEGNRRQHAALLASSEQALRESRRLIRELPRDADASDEPA
jgi:hypothetical protein